MLKQDRRQAKIGEGDELVGSRRSCKDFPLAVQRLIRWRAAKAKEARECRASSTARFDADAGRGHRARRAAGRSARRRAARRSSPISRRPCPGCSRTFCALNAEHRSDRRRRRAADASPTSTDWSERLARALVARGIEQGRPGRHRHAQLPGVDRRLYGDPQGGRRRDPAQRLVGSARARACARADRAGADHRRRAARASGIARLCGRVPRSSALPIDRPLERGAGAAARRSRTTTPSLPEIAPEDDATILFTSGSTGDSKGALSTHRAVTTGAYTYATGLIVLLGLLTDEGRAPATKPRVPAQRALVPRHRRSAGDAQQLRHRPLHGDDAQVGRGRGAAADREGKDHLFRRRADDEPRADDPSRPRQIRPVIADRHHRRRRAAAGQPCRAAAGGVPVRPARRSAMA